MQDKEGNPFPHILALATGLPTTIPTLHYSLWHDTTYHLRLAFSLYSHEELKIR